MTRERERWNALVDAISAGEPIDVADRAFADDFDDPAAQRERDLYQRLARAGQPGPLSPEDRARSGATLGEFRRTRPAVPSVPRRAPLIAGVLVVLAAAVALLWVALPNPIEATAETSAAIVSRGTLMVDLRAVEEGDTIPTGRWAVARGMACIEFADGGGCVTSDSRLRIRDAQIDLEDGSIDVSGSMSISIGGHRIDVSSGNATISVNESSVRVEPSAGDVRLSTDGIVRVLPAGETTTIPRPGAPEPSVEPEPTVVPEPSVEPEPTVVPEPGDADLEPSSEATESGEDDPPRTQPPHRPAQTPGRSASELLADARAHIVRKERGRALATYQAVQRRYPHSPEAHAAHVSIGKLQLQSGHARSALNAYTKYLAHGGPLAEEAHWGRIQSLHRLGRAVARNEAIAALRTAFPKSLYLRRADELAASE